MYKRCRYCNKKYEYDSECICDGVKKARQIRQRSYDKYVRKSDDNKKYDSFYHSLEWRRLTEYMKSRYNGLCIMCLLKDNRLNKYDVMHHILELRTTDGWNHRLDSDMVIPLCHSCHNSVHSNYTDDVIDMLIRLIDEYKETY